MPLIASLMAFSLRKVTKPKLKPLDLSISRSERTCVKRPFDSMISLNGENLSSASLYVAQASPPTKLRMMKLK
ncbi:unnamed protein product, partial [Prunus brigantina]